MKINMKNWLDETVKSSTKKALPILSFPSIELLGVSVGEITRDSDKQAQGMYEVAKRCDSAASVSYMDLSVEAECFGSEIAFVDNEVPTVIGKIINTPEDAEKLSVPEIGSARSGVYIDAIKKASELISDRPILAGMIGPFSLAARLFDVTDVMIACFEEPDAVHTVLDKVTTFLCNYARAYKEAGANGIVMAEPVAGLLDPYTCAEFSGPYVKRIVDELQDDDFIIVYHNCGGNAIFEMDSILDTGCAAYHFGNAIDIEEALKIIPETVVTMGNIDPVGVLKDASPETVREKTLSLMEKCTKYPNFVISSGCDIPPHTPWENLDAFFGAVKEFYGK